MGELCRPPGKPTGWGPTERIPEKECFPWVVRRLQGRVGGPVRWTPCSRPVWSVAFSPVGWDR